MDPLSLALKSTVVLATAGLLSVLLRRHSAAARHLVWTIALLALPLLPGLALIVPELPVDSTPPSALHFSTTVTAATAAPTSPIAARSFLPATPAPWRPTLTQLWALGVALMLAHLACGLFALARLRRACPVLSHHPLILQSAPGSMPLTFGFLRPVILLPADADAWPADRRDHVILHELAHIQRHDFALQLLARVALAAFWWQPLAWFAWSRFLSERETAADDLVLNEGVQPSLYAGHLLAVAAASRSPHFAIGMARTLPLETRLQAILSPTTNRKAPHRLAIALGLFATIAALTPLAALRAQSPVPALLAQAAQEYREHRPAAALTLYRQALPLLGNEPAAAPAFLSLGVDALQRQEYDEAYLLFDRLPLADPTYSTRARLWQALTLEFRGQPTLAEPLFKQAITQANAPTADLLVALELYARFLVSFPERAADANTYVAQAAALRQSTRRAPAASSSTAVRSGGDVLPPKLLAKVEPTYSEEARAARLTGTAVLLLEVDANGVPQNITVLRSPGLGLDAEAIVAVTKWRFQPGTKNGVPVAVLATIEVNFRLL